MNNKLICPFCQQELHKDPDGYYSCYTDNCSVMNAGGNGASGTESLWTALIQAKQDLEQYEHKDNLQQQLNANNNQIQENYKQIVEIDERIIENLEKDLEIARKALEEIDTTRCIPQQTLISLGKRSKTTRFNAGNIICVATPDYIHNTLEQIEHKE